MPRGSGTPASADLGTGLALRGRRGLAYPPAIRRILSTTNAIENVHRQLRKIIKTPDQLPTDEAALKLLYLALRHIQTRWATGRQWTAALPHFAVLFGDRFVPET